MTDRGSCSAGAPGRTSRGSELSELLPERAVADSEQEGVRVGCRSVATFDFRVPDDQEAGVYANALTVWSTAHEFTLDFGVTLPPYTDDQGLVIVPARVVARVKVPPTVMSEMIDAISRTLIAYEQRLGPIAQPGSEQLRIEIPDDPRSLFDESTEEEEQE